MVCLVQTLAREANDEDKYDDDVIEDNKYTDETSKEDHSNEEGELVDKSSKRDTRFVVDPR